jgi:hypothetical protein
MTAQGGGYNPQPHSDVPVCDLTEADKEVLDAEYQQILKDDKKTQEDF